MIFEKKKKLSKNEMCVFFFFRNIFHSEKNWERCDEKRIFGLNVKFLAILVWF